MTESELLAMAGRVARATPGPWAYSQDFEVFSTSASLLEVEDATLFHCHPSSLPSVDDAEFIKHARAELPQLLAEVLNLRAAIRQHRDERGGNSNEADINLYGVLG